MQIAGREVCKMQANRVQNTSVLYFDRFGCFIYLKYFVVSRRRRRFELRIDKMK